MEHKVICVKVNVMNSTGIRTRLPDFSFREPFKGKKKLQYFYYYEILVLLTFMVKK